jgi:hypothetical protein
MVTLMSKGPGQINAFTLEDLCERVYPGVNRIEKKHHVSVARAARNLGRLIATFPCSPLATRVEGQKTAHRSFKSPRCSPVAEGVATRPATPDGAYSARTGTSRPL